MKKITTTVALLLILSFILSTFSISLVNAVDDSWTTKEPMPTARSNFGVAVVNKKIYAIGGLNGSVLGTNEMYDTVTGTWTTKTPMPTPRSHFEICVYKNKIYAIGGMNWSSLEGGFVRANEVYDPITDTWETKTPMPTTKADMCANIINGEIYLTGGAAYVMYFPEFSYATSTHVYSPETDAWTTKAHIPTSVAHYSSVVFDNKLYVIGGMTAWTWNITLNQVYYPDNDTWVEAEHIPLGVDNAAATATSGNLAPKRVFVIGGAQKWGAVNFTQIYDPEKDSWSSGNPMPTARLGLGVAVVDDLLYAIGGRYIENDTSYYFTVNELYTPVG